MNVHEESMAVLYLYSNWGGKSNAKKLILLQNILNI